MKVVLFERNNKNTFSVENINKNLVENLKDKIKIRIFKSTYATKGIFNMLKLVIDSRKNQGDVNHITGDIHYCSFLLKKEKTIITMLDCEKLINKEYGIFKRAVYKWIWFKLPEKKATKIITISRESKKKLVKYAGINPDKIKIIYVGIDSKFKKIKLTKKEKIELLKNYKNKRTVLHIGVAQKNKNIKRLILALKDLKYIKFVKIGELAEEERLLIKRYGIDYIQFKNISLDLVIRIYNSVDCLVFPSTVEGFGMPIVEAQKCSCPVITSNISSMPEVGGKGAYYVNPFSVKSIREGITRVLSDKTIREKIVKEGLKNSKRFDWDNIANKYLKAYYEVYKKQKNNKF